MKLQFEGDTIERNEYAFIEVSIPAYIKIWERFIGNDGMNKIIDLLGEDNEHKQKRILFSQYHYTVFESLILMNRIIDVTEEMKLPAKFRNDYYDLQNYLICFHSHTGRIRDNIRYMYNCYCPNESEMFDNNFKKYWLERHIFLHGKKQPFYSIDEGFFIPQLNAAGENYINEPWVGFSKDDFVEVKNYLKKCFCEIVAIVANELEKIYNMLETYMKERNITPIKPLNETTLLFTSTPAPSGYLFFDQTSISGSFD